MIEAVIVFLLLCLVGGVISLVAMAIRELLE